MYMYIGGVSTRGGWGKGAVFLDPGGRSLSLGGSFPLPDRGGFGRPGFVDCDELVFRRCAGRSEKRQFGPLMLLLAVPSDTSWASTGVRR